MLGDDEARPAHERYALPGPCRVLFRAGFANVNPHAVTRVDFHKDDRTPLLVIGNGRDHTVLGSVSRAAATLLGRSKAVVESREYVGRPHFTAGTPGWEAVADYALEWADRYVSAQCCGRT